MVQRFAQKMLKGAALQSSKLAEIFQTSRGFEFFHTHFFKTLNFCTCPLPCTPFLPLLQHRHQTLRKQRCCEHKAVYPVQHMLKHVTSDHWGMGAVYHTSSESPNANETHSQPPNRAKIPVNTPISVLSRKGDSKIHGSTNCKNKLANHPPPPF